MGDNSLLVETKQKLWKISNCTQTGFHFRLRRWLLCHYLLNMDMSSPLESELSSWSCGRESELEWLVRNMEFSTQRCTARTAPSSTASSELTRTLWRTYLSLLPANHGRSLPPQADSGWSLGLDRWEACPRSWLQHWRSREENERSFWIFWSSCHARCNNPHCHTTYLII